MRWVDRVADQFPSGTVDIDLWETLDLEDGVRKTTPSSASHATRQITICYSDVLSSV